MLMNGGKQIRKVVNMNMDLNLELDLLQYGNLICRILEGVDMLQLLKKLKNGKIYISESMWHGVTFKYREIYETSYLYGYIYLDKPNY